MKNDFEDEEELISDLGEKKIKEYALRFGSKKFSFKKLAHYIIFKKVKAELTEGKSIPYIVRKLRTYKVLVYRIRRLLKKQRPKNL